MANNDYFIVGLLHTFAVIFFMGGIFLDYYDFTLGLFVLIAVSIFSNFMRKQKIQSKSSKSFTHASTNEVKTRDYKEVFCIQCGSKIGEEDDYCPSCGVYNSN